MVYNELLLYNYRGCTCHSIVWKYVFLLHILNKSNNIINAGYWVLSENCNNCGSVNSKRTHPQAFVGHFIIYFFQKRCWSIRTPKSFVSVTCLITVFSRVRGTLTLTFFCLGWKIIKFVLVKFRDNLFTLSQITIFASSLLTIETRWLASLWEQKILVSSANSKDWVRLETLGRSLM